MVSAHEWPIYRYRPQKSHIGRSLILANSRDPNRVPKAPQKTLTLIKTNISPLQVYFALQTSKPGYRPELCLPILSNLEHSDSCNF